MSKQNPRALPGVESLLGGGGSPIRATPTNITPTAGYTFTVSGLTATVTDTSTDSDGTIATRSMDWGDGGSAETLSGAGPWTHDYASADTYTATLTVTDDGGLTDDFADDITAVIETISHIANASDPLQAFADACGMAFKMDYIWIGNAATGDIVELGGSGIDLVNSGVDQGQTDARLGAGTVCVFDSLTDKLSVASSALDIGTGSVALFEVWAPDNPTSTNYSITNKRDATPLGYESLLQVTGQRRFIVRTSAGNHLAAVNGPGHSPDAQVDLCRRNVTTNLVTLDTMVGAGSAAESTVASADSTEPFVIGDGVAAGFIGSWGLVAFVKGANAELVTSTHRANLQATLGF